MTTCAQPIITFGQIIAASCTRPQGHTPPHLGPFQVCGTAVFANTPDAELLGPCTQPPGHSGPCQHLNIRGIMR